MQDIYDEVRDYVDKLGTDKGGFMGFVASFNGIYSLGAPEEMPAPWKKRLKNTAAAGHSRPQAENAAKRMFCGRFSFSRKKAAADCFFAARERIRSVAQAADSGRPAMTKRSGTNEIWR